jgi:mono/diheme cytochrome c family protein
MARSHPAVRRLRVRADYRPFTGLVVLMALAASTTPVDAQGEGGKGAGKVSAQEYEGWRQYNANCARCHGQDALPNPVAADLLRSLAEAGPMRGKKSFTAVVMNGRTAKGMPAFAKQLDGEKVSAIYSYLVGRADKRIPAGRPKRPT